MIAVPAVHNGGEIDVHDVTRLQYIVTGDPVTDHVVDAGTAALGKPLVVEAGRDVPMLDRVLVDQPINLAGRDAGLHMRAHVIHQFGIELARRSHGDAFRLVEAQ